MYVTPVEDQSLVLVQISDKRPHTGIGSDDFYSLLENTFLRMIVVW